MACPYMNNDAEEERYRSRKESTDSGMGDSYLSDLAKHVLKKREQGGVRYSEYLQLPTILSCQHMKSFEAGEPIPEEHLFIVIHQTIELWFKQILFDLDVIRSLFDNLVVDETKTLRIICGLERTVRILKLLADQIQILETMSPLDFVEFRKYLTPASGFQSLQFRLLESKLGVTSDRRVKIHAQQYMAVFDEAVEQQKIAESEGSPSLLHLVDRWLSNMPGLCPTEDEPGFTMQYLSAVEKFLDDMKKDALLENGEAKLQAIAEYEKTKRSFDTITDEREHLLIMQQSDRRLSHKATMGALMIYFHRHLPRFSQPYQILHYLMDIDALLIKWRNNHLLLVQRMLGSKQGTGGSSGYLYLRSTISDRYKVFLDLFNLSTWLIPSRYIADMSLKKGQRAQSDSQ